MLVKTSKKLYNPQNYKLNTFNNNENKKGIPLIDQHDKNGFYGGKFGGNFIAETLKKLLMTYQNYLKSVEKIKILLKIEIILYKNYVGKPTRFIKLQNLTDHLGGAQKFTRKWFLMRMVSAQNL